MRDIRRSLGAACATLILCGLGCTSVPATPTRDAAGDAVARAPRATPTQPPLLASASAPPPTPDAVEAARRVIARKQAKLASQGPKAFDKPAEAMRFHLDQRLGEGMTQLPLERLRAEREAIRARERALAASDARDTRDAGRSAGQSQQAPSPGGLTSWQWLGPGNIGGRTRALVIDPNDPLVMYAGGVAGGIWKSVDGGASWNVADDMLINLAISCLAMDPADSSVLYAGTGEGFYFSDTFVQGLGIFKSTDAGATWTQLPGTVSGVPEGAFHYVNKLVVSPNNSDRVYAATRTGVWKSADAGQTWSVKLANPTYLAVPPTSNGSLVGCTDLVIRSDTAPDMLFAAFGSAQSDGLFRTFNGGNQWQAYTVGSNQGRMTLALAPGDQDILYLLMADNGTGGGLGQLVNLFRSDDGGDSFTAQVDPDSLTGPWLLSNLILATGCLEGDSYSQGWYDNIVAVDPLDPDIVWVGGVDLFRSDDGGQNFEIPGYWIFYTADPTPPYYVHPDQHTIVFHPDYDGLGNQTMYVGNDGGLFRTENARAATSLEDCPLPGDEPLPEVVWESLNNGYGVTQFYHGDAAKQTDVFVGGAQDNGSNRVQAVDTPDDWKLVFGGDGGYVAIDPRDPQVMYVEYQGFPTIQKSVDGGETFVEATAGISDTDGVFITPFAMDQTDPDVLWSGGRRPWRTTTAANYWFPVGPDFAGPDRISAIAIAPSDHDVVYLGFTNGYVVRTTNGSDPLPSWEVFSNGLVGAWVSSLAVDPLDPDVAYCTYSTYGVPHVLRSSDGGQSWIDIDGLGVQGVPDIPVHWIAVRPCNRRQLYVGTELGIFVSDDAGGSWQPANTGFANVVVESLDWRDEDTLVAFTHGRGAYLTELQPCPGGERQAEADEPLAKPAP